MVAVVAPCGALAITNVAAAGASAVGAGTGTDAGRVRATRTGDGWLLSAAPSVVEWAAEAASHYVIPDIVTV